jgi:mRNA-degrading endonuclease RelE of RelBE toxin-antitoxin system
MNFKLLVSDRFQKQAKRLVKKYPSLKKELSELRDSLLKDPLQGTPLGHECYKIRLAIASKGKGKSGGARVITYVQVVQTCVFLLSIYDKSEKENITVKELQEILKNI